MNLLLLRSSRFDVIDQSTHKGTKNSIEFPCVRMEIIKTNMSVAINPNLRKFPLYETLLAKLTEKVNQSQISITPEYTSKLACILNNLDLERSKQVTLLLIHYLFANSTEPTNPFTTNNCTQKSSGLPFDIKTSPNGKGFSFDLNKIPPAFQALLGVYCCLI